MYHVSLTLYIRFGGIRFLQFVPKDESVWSEDQTTSVPSDATKTMLLQMSSQKVFFRSGHELVVSCDVEFWWITKAQHQTCPWKELCCKEDIPLTNSATNHQKKHCSTKKGCGTHVFFNRRCLTVENPSRIHRLASDFGRSSAESSDRMGWWDFFCFKSLVVGTWVVFLE